MTEEKGPPMMTTEDGKPFFGPRVSPAIFARKWLDKFQELLDRHYIQPLTGAPISSTIMYIVCIEGLNHFMQFCKDADQLSLHQHDFPDLPKPDGYEGEMAKSNVSSATKLHGLQHNPFIAAGTAMLLVDCFLQRLREVKYGGKLFGKTWQSLPFEHRQRLNDAFELVEEGREAGWWSISDEDRKLNKESFARKEARAQQLMA